ncbi:hypothetical protein AB1Y20_022970 [Prymnesium parvum]|uniref:peptidylprolyl isomerase n=1 Tax=Prymnesium parvum TaxID=97485 RepID=A0AB34JES7_PRYPA
MALERATLARERGNDFFKENKHAEANQQYAEAIALLQEASSPSADAAALREALHKCRLNRAACLLKLQGYSAAGQEATLVLKEDPSNAKAHYRQAQALEAIGDLERAKAAFAEAIKLNPSWREPRAELEALRSRCKENPRLAQGLQDMMLVETRGFQSLNHADLKTSRKQMELLLKDARQLKATHWETRALLALALLCEEEAECEAASDYLLAARRHIDASNDRLAEVYFLQSSAVVLLDQGNAEEARARLEQGLLLADEMCETGLANRIVGNLATAHLKCGDMGRALEYGAQALQCAKDKGDANFEAICSAIVGQAHRTRGNAAAARPLLERAISIAASLGNAHTLGHALVQLGLLLVNDGSNPAEMETGFMHLKRAVEISSENGLLRTACDDVHDLHVAQLRLKRTLRDESLAALEAALAQAKDIGYRDAQVRLYTAIGMGRMLPGVGDSATSEDLTLAEAALRQGLEVAQKVGDASAAALLHEHLSKLYLLQAERLNAAEADAARERALTHAQTACDAPAASAADKARRLTQSAVARLLAHRAAADPLAAAEAARAQLEVACQLAADAAQEARAAIAMSAALETLGRSGESLAALERAAALDTRLPSASYERYLLASAECKAEGDAEGAIANLKAALKQL